MFILTVTNGFACSDLDSVIVVVNHLPESNAGPDTAFCSGGSASIGTNNTPGYHYSWNTANGLSDSTLANPTVTWTNSDTIADTLTFIVTTTVDSCSTSDSVTVIVFPLPIVDAGEDKYLCSESTDTIGSTPIGTYTYSWNTANGLSESTLAKPTVARTNSENIAADS